MSSVEACRGVARERVTSAFFSLHINCWHNRRNWVSTSYNLRVCSLLQFFIPTLDKSFQANIRLDCPQGAYGCISVGNKMAYDDAPESPYSNTSTMTKKYCPLALKAQEFAWVEVGILLIRVDDWPIVILAR